MARVWTSATVITVHSKPSANIFSTFPLCLNSELVSMAFSSLLPLAGFYRPCCIGLLIWLAVAVRAWAQVNKDSATWGGLWSSLDSEKPLSVYILSGWLPIWVSEAFLGSGPEVPSQDTNLQVLLYWQLFIFKNFKSWPSSFRCHFTSLRSLTARELGCGCHPSLVGKQSSFPCSGTV